MESNVLDIIDSTTALIAIIIALLSLIWSIYINKILIKKNSDRLKLSIIERATELIQGSLKANPVTKVVLNITFISPQKRNARITHFSYRIYKNKFTYSLRKIPILKKLFKPKALVPREFFDNGIASLFSNGRVDLMDGDTTLFVTSNTELIKDLKLKKQNIIIFEIIATPEFCERIKVNAIDLFDTD